MISKREVEELILTMADVVMEKRYLEEENRTLKETLKERDEMINKYFERTHRGYCNGVKYGIRKKYEKHR